ncbi:hypothetical protein Tco_0830480 [Tanacetum coccineum]
MWDRVKLLIEGLELLLQKRESKLYDKFDTFTSDKGETIHSYYLRYAQLINDMSTIEMIMKTSSVRPFKRQNVARAYTVGPGEKKVYEGSKPLCPKCNYHHDGQCAPKYTKCKRTGHLAQDSRRQAAAANNQRAPGAN